MTTEGTGGSPRGEGSTTGFDVRTLWECLFDQETGIVAYRFYLGDEMTADGGLEALYRLLGISVLPTGAYEEQGREYFCQDEYVANLFPMAALAQLRA